MAPELSYFSFIKLLTLFRKFDELCSHLQMLLNKRDFLDLKFLCSQIIKGINIKH